MSQTRTTPTGGSGFTGQPAPAANPLLNRQQPPAVSQPPNRQPPPAANPVLSRQPPPASHPVLSSQPPPAANPPSNRQPLSAANSLLCRSTSSSGVHRDGSDLGGSYWARGDVPTGPGAGSIPQRGPSGVFTTRSSAYGVTTVSGTSMQYRPAPAATGVNATPLGNRPPPIIKTGLPGNWYR